MKDSIVIKFDIGSDINFYEEEVPFMKILNKRDSHIFQVENGRAFGFYYTSNRYRIFEVIIKEVYSDTRSRIESLMAYSDDYDQPKAMQMYYEYSISTANNYWVQMNRGMMSRSYVGGYKKAEGEIKLQFVESRPSGVAVELEEIGV